MIINRKVNGLCIYNQLNEGYAFWEKCFMNLKILRASLSGTIRRNTCRLPSDASLYHKDTEPLPVRNRASLSDIEGNHSTDPNRIRTAFCWKLSARTHLLAPRGNLVRIAENQRLLQGRSTNSDLFCRWACHRRKSEEASFIWVTGMRTQKNTAGIEPHIFNSSHSFERDHRMALRVFRRSDRIYKCSSDR